MGAHLSTHHYEAARDVQCSDLLERAVLHELAWLADDDGRSAVSLAVLERRLHRNNAAITVRLRRLEKRGLIERQSRRHGDQRPTEYRVLLASKVFLPPEQFAAIAPWGTA